MDPITLISALVPFVGNIITRLTDHFTGGAQPQNAQEMIDLKRTDTDQLNAISQLDSIGNISTWVANIRALQRPLCVVGILALWFLSTINVLALSEARYVLLSNLASSAVFYLFGDRTLMYLRRNVRS